jgi:hypothetical protein
MMAATESRCSVDSSAFCQATPDILVVIRYGHGASTSSYNRPSCQQAGRSDFRVGGDQGLRRAFGRVTLAPRSGVAEQLDHDIAVEGGRVRPSDTGHRLPSGVGQVVTFQDLGGVGPPEAGVANARAD